MSDSNVTAVAAVSVIAVCVYHNSCCCFDAEAFATMAITVVTPVVVAVAAATIFSVAVVIQIAAMANFATAAVTTAVDAQ